MTELLEKAVAEVSRLPEIEQNKYAAWLLGELTQEQTLAAMLAEARAEYERGETKPMSKKRVIADN